MDDVTRHAVEARADWRAYYSAVEDKDPRYHNRPDCVDGAAIREADIREGTGHYPLCEKCHTAQHTNT